MNAETQEDATEYFYNFPGNRVETVVLSRIGAVPPSRDARVLQRAFRGSRGNAACARNVESRWQILFEQMMATAK